MSAASRFRLAALFLLAAPLSVLACSGQLRIELEESGVYALDHAAIVAAQPGLADCAVDDLALTWKGEEVPIRVVARGERLADGDRIEWVGRQLHGPQSWFDSYSVRNVYLLGAAPGPHARMRELPAPDAVGATASRRLHLEQENLMIRLDQRQQKPGEEPDVWQWAKLTQVDPAPFETTFDLPDLDARAGSAELTLNFRGLSAVRGPYDRKEFADRKPADHTVEIVVNGRTLEPFAWDGRDEVSHAFEVPVSALKAAGNHVELRVPRRALPWEPATQAVDVVMFNWLDARYPVTGDLADAALPLSPRSADERALSLAWQGAQSPALYGSDGAWRPGAARGDRFAFASAEPGTELFPATPQTVRQPLALRAVRGDEWRSPEKGYDYLIVSHSRLIDAIRPLAEFHERRGLAVAILDIDEVYDQYNHGIVHPRAIRNLVDAAWHRWPKKPRFLLLVGDSSFDIRHETYNDLAYAKWTNRELLFPGHFGSVPGGKYEKQPEKLADRNLIPTWQFPSPEGQSASDNWFAAGDGDDWHPVVAVGRIPVVEPEEVTAVVDKTIAYMSKPQPGAWRRDVMFITDEIETFKKASDRIAGELGKEGFAVDKVYANPAVEENAAHQRAIHDGIDEGRLLVHFIGHGGRYIWRTGPPDLRSNQDLFTLDDVSKLGNGDRLPMVLSMTCYSAPFDNPTEDSIGERFLREPGKGAVAVFAASWRNTPTPEFSKSVIDELLVPGATIGEAIVAAKRKSKDRVLVEMYNLLGDPALVLERPQDQARIALDDHRHDRGVLVDLGQPSFDGNVHVDWLDATGNKLQSIEYRAADPRFRLPIPSDEAAAVRVYAACTRTGRDMVGGLDIAAALRARSVAKSPVQVVSDWWKRLTYTPPPRRERTPDTILLSEFDRDETPPEPQAAGRASAASP